MPDRTDTKLESGQFVEMRWSMASDTEAAHWAKAFPEEMPSTHEFRYRWEWNEKTKRKELVVGVYPKAIATGEVVPAELHKITLAERHAIATTKLDSPEAKALSDEIKRQKHVQTLNALKPADLHTEAAMLGVAVKDAKGKDRPKANIVAECAEKMAGK
jgi:hypothetical protein